LAEGPVPAGVEETPVEASTPAPAVEPAVTLPVQPRAPVAPQKAPVPTETATAAADKINKKTQPIVDPDEQELEPL
jgi:hypothetical protein